MRLICTMVFRMTAAATRPRPQPGPSRWYGAAVVALAAALFLVRLGARALWASEGRWAEVVREMQLSSNYFWPTINGALYYDKPLLSYWFIVAATRVTGGLNEAATRLPSAVFGLAGVILIIVMARRLYDRATAAWAGFILATSFSYVFFARHASADVETTTGVLAALTLFVWHREHRDGWWVVGLWLIMAATALTKGLQGFALPLMVIGLYSLLAEGGQFEQVDARVGKSKIRLAAAPLLVVFQSQDPHRIDRRGYALLPALRDFQPSQPFRRRTLPGVPRKCGPILRALRPSWTDLHLPVCDFRPDGAVVGVHSRSPAGGPSQSAPGGHVSDGRRGCLRV